MNKLITAASLAAMLASTAAFANPPNTASAFEDTYGQHVNDAQRQGRHWEKRCWQGYCRTSMIIKYSDGFGFVADTVYDSGNEERASCFTPTATPDDRTCWISTGEVISEHNDGHAWQVTKTLASHFEDDAPPAPAPKAAPASTTPAPAAVPTAARVKMYDDLAQAIPNWNDTNVRPVSRDGWMRLIPTRTTPDGAL